jgi:hypothetical protein
VGIASNGSCGSWTQRSGGPNAVDDSLMPVVFNRMPSIDRQRDWSMIVEVVYLPFNRQSLKGITDPITKCWGVRCLAPHS